MQTAETTRRRKARISKQSLRDAATLLQALVGDMERPKPTLDRAAKRRAFAFRYHYKGKIPLE